jgi:hypothetical protein
VVDGSLTGIPSDASPAAWPLNAVGSKGSVFDLTAGSFTWVDLGPVSVTQHLNDVEDISNAGTNIRICGDEGVVLFRDNGAWQDPSPKSETTEPLYRLSFQSTAHGFGIGQQSLVTEYRLIIP